MNILLNESPYAFERFMSVKITSLLSNPPDSYLSPIIKVALVSSCVSMKLDRYQYPLNISEDLLRQLYINLIVKISDKLNIFEQEPSLFLREMCRQTVKKFPELGDMFQ